MSSIPSPFFNPQAAPVSQFTQPFVAAPTPVQVQVGQGLEDIGPAFMNFSTTLAQFVGSQVAKQNQEAAEAGRVKVFQSRQSFRKLVESGKLDPAANPWEAYGAAQADAVIQAETFKGRLQADYDQEIASNPAMIDSVGAFDEFSKKKLEEAASVGVQNPIWINTFIEEVTPSINDMSKRHVVAVGDFRRKKMTDALTIGIAADLREYMQASNDGKPPVLGGDLTSSGVVKASASKVQARIDEVYQTIGGDAANSAAIDVALKMRLEYGDDPRLKAVIESLKTPAGPIHKTERYRAAEALLETELDAARSRLTIEKTRMFDEYLSKQFDLERLNGMSLEDIANGRGFPAWDDIEADVRKMGVGTELYFKLKKDFEERKSAIIQDNMVRFMEDLAYNQGSSIGEQFAEAAKSPDKSALIALAENQNVAAVQAQTERTLRRMGRAYNIPDSAVPRSVDRSLLESSAIDAAMNAADRDPTTNQPSSEGATVLLEVARALDMKHMHRVTDRIRSSVEIWNRPQSDVTNIPPQLHFSIDMYATARRANETSRLGLDKETTDFLDLVVLAESSGTSRSAALAAAKTQMSPAMRSIKMEELTTDDLDTKLEDIRENFFGLNRFEFGRGRGIRDIGQQLAYSYMLQRYGKEQALDKGFREAMENSVVVSGEPVYAPAASSYPALGRNADSWEAAMNEAIKTLNEQIGRVNETRATKLPTIELSQVSLAPRSASRNNEVFDLVFVEDGTPFDAGMYGYVGIKSSFTLQELSDMAVKISKENSSYWKKFAQPRGIRPSLTNFKTK